jgi:hypothetical protein
VLISLIFSLENLTQAIGESCSRSLGLPESVEQGPLYDPGLVEFAGKVESSQSIYDSESYKLIDKTIPLSRLSEMLSSVLFAKSGS